MSHRYYYLIYLQFLGFRYHGWQKQPKLKTVQGMVDRTLKFVLGERPFKTLGASRTDAMVSAHQCALELFVEEELDEAALLENLNRNLPSDIRALSIKEVDAQFNVIQSSKEKEYLYLFSYGERHHPFCAPFMVYVMEPLDIDRMKLGAKLFEGYHYFGHYCHKPKEHTVLHREVTSCDISENGLFTANFFPEKSYLFRVCGPGFLRHQVRLMMGALFALGKGELSLADIGGSLRETGGTDFLAPMAPASGLMLYDIAFDHDR